MRVARVLAFLAGFLVVCAPLLPTPVQAAAPDLRYRIWTRDDGLPQGSVRGIAQTPDGYLWIATLDGLVRFDGVRMVVFARPDIPEMTSNRCLTMFVDRRGALWVGTDDGRILQIVGAHVRNFGPRDGVRFSTLDGLIEDGDGRIWASTPALDGPAVFDGSRWTSSSTKPTIAPPALPLGVKIPAMPLPAGAVHGSPMWTKSARGRIWAFADGYLHRYGAETWTTFPTPLPSGLRPVTMLFEDREGSVWIGSEGGGLAQARPAAVRGIVPADPRSQNVNTVAEDPSGRVWVVTAGGSFVFERDTLTSLATKPWWPRVGSTAIKPDADGRVLAGGLDGLYRVQPDRGFEQLLGASVGPIADFLRDRQGALWVATSQGLRHQSGSTWTEIKGLPFQEIKVLSESRDGGVWVGAYGGLARVAGDRVQAWTIADGLSSDRIRALQEDDRGALWIGTYDGGLMRFADGKFVSILKRDGLFDNGAFTVLDGGDGRYYMCSNRGIYSVPIVELEAFASGAARRVTSRAYRSADGMPSSECNGGSQPAGWRRADGTLWFPTQGGIAVLDPQAVTANTVPPPVVVEQVTTERRTIEPGDPIELAPGERRLEVRYTANTFIRPDAVRFRHQLVNFDRDWVEAGSQRFVQYSYIPPGDYTLKILAANSDGVWSPEGVSLPIHVRPYWWQTTWVRVVAVLLGLTLVWAGVQRRLSALNRRRAEQDAFARRLLESQEAERKRIAHELHDGIGQTLVVIKNRALLGMDAGGDPGLVTHLTEISSAAGGAIDEVRKVAYGLRPYQLDRLGVTRALQSLVEQTAAASGLALTADIADLEGLLPKNDEVNVYRIVQEALSNMVRHAHAKTGRVTVSAAQRDIDIRIEDDGAGFDPADHDGGLGLAGIAERARILGGRISLRSGPGQGTALNVVIPIREPR